MKILLDTSAIVEYRRHNEDVMLLIEEAEDSCTSSLCAFEVLAGSIKDLETESFIASLGALPFTLRDSKRAALVYSALVKAGKMVNIMDVLIYVQAAEHGLSIITKDRDYSIINTVTKGNLKVFTLQGERADKHGDP